MSGSEAEAVDQSIMSGREPYGGVQTNQSPPSHSQAANHPPNMRLAFSPDGAVVYKPIMPTDAYQPAAPPTDVPLIHQQQSQSGGLNINVVEPMKRKRGRPRKYSPDAGNMGINLTSPASQPPSIQAAGFASPPQAIPPLSPPSGKKARGRPPGSGKKQQQIAGSGGAGFVPHVITVKAGEDVSAKIMSFSQNGPRAVCILSANGAISNVTIRQAATSGGTVTYEGRFEILSLSGSFLLSEDGGQRSRTGGLSVSLAGPDGRVLGGGVAGLLTAATPVQVVVGSFVAGGGQKEAKLGNRSEPSSAGPKLFPGAPAGASPPSRGAISESSGGPGSPLDQSTGACNNNDPQGMANVPWK